MAEIDDILSRATPELRRLLSEAFEAGRAAMRRDLVAVLTPVGITTDTQELGNPKLSVERSEKRATPGTVRPKIMELIETFEEGVTASEIARTTGFKENSIRGTLATLRAEGFAERHGDRWVKRVRAPSASATEPHKSLGLGDHTGAD